MNRPLAAVKTSEIFSLVSGFLLIGLENLLRQNQSNTKLICENIVAWAHSRFLAPGLN